MFLYAENTQTLKIDNLCFFQMSFFSTKCAPLFLKLERILILMIKRAKLMIFKKKPI